MVHLKDTAGKEHINIPLRDQNLNIFLKTLLISDDYIHTVL